jgi:hypothetical protein
MSWKCKQEDGKKEVVMINKELEAEQGMKGKDVKQCKWHATYLIKTTVRFSRRRDHPEFPLGLSWTIGIWKSKM